MICNCKPNKKLDFFEHEFIQYARSIDCNTKEQIYNIVFDIRLFSEEKLKEYQERFKEYSNVCFILDNE